MKILITGATGFIGRNLTKRLVADEHDIHVLVRQGPDQSFLPESITVHVIPGDQTGFETLFGQDKFDGLVHLATFFTSAHTASDLELLIEANITFGTQLLEEASVSNLPWFINTGTFSQYSGPDNNVSANLYSATKQAFADIVQYYAALDKTNIMTLELFNTFGEGDTRKKIFNLWDTASRTGEPMDMSPGDQIIDISHVDNIVDGFYRAIELLHKDKNRSLNGKKFTLPSSERMSLRELASVFAEVIGRPLKINFGAEPYRPLEIMNPIHGNPLPGWTPRVSLREGIKRTFVN